jgi:hypothetical protein
MHPKIKNINTNDDYILVVEFDNGIQKKYDFKKNFQYPAFQDLRNTTLFKQVKVDPGGYGISWNDEIDLSEYELWQNGVA